MLDLSSVLLEITTSLKNLRGDFEKFKRVGRPLSRGGNLVRQTRENLVADYTLTQEDFLVIFNTTGGDLNATLPPTSEVYDPDTLGGQVYAFKKSVLANNLNINVDAGDSGGIEGSSTVTLTSAWSLLIIQAGDGVWYRLN